jgi:hypothetical protein
VIFINKLLLGLSSSLPVINGFESKTLEHRSRHEFRVKEVSVLACRE